MTWELPRPVRLKLIRIPAMIRDDKKVLLLQNQQPIKPIIYIYTSAGKLLQQIQVCIVPL
jgi:hypothetical protein